MVILYVAAVPVASYISIASPTEAEAGKDRVLAAAVFTKYLLLAAKVMLEDTVEEAGPVVIDVLPPKDTADPLIVIAEFVKAELGILDKVLIEPLIVLLLNV